MQTKKSLEVIYNIIETRDNVNVKGFRSIKVWHFNLASLWMQLLSETILSHDDDDDDGGCIHCAHCTKVKLRIFPLTFLEFFVARFQRIIIKCTWEIVSKVCWSCSLFFFFSCECVYQSILKLYHWNASEAIDFNWKSWLAECEITIEIIIKCFV